MHLLVFVYSSLQIQFDKYIIQCLKVINCDFFFLSLQILIMITIKLKDFPRQNSNENVFLEFCHNMI